MQRQVMKDLNDMIKAEPKKWEPDLEGLKRSMTKRRKAERFREMIYQYLRKYNKPIWMLSKEDIAIMTEWMNTLDVSMFMDEVKKCLEVNWWKPIKRVIQNKKSILFQN